MAAALATRRLRSAIALSCRVADGRPERVAAAPLAVATGAAAKRAAVTGVAGPGPGSADAVSPHPDVNTGSSATVTSNAAPTSAARKVFLTHAVLIKDRIGIGVARPEECILWLHKQHGL